MNALPSLPAPVNPMPGGRPDPRPAGARQDAVRRHNLSTVLDQILTAPVPVSRADIAATTKLTRATVSSLVDSLIGAGMVTELAPLAPRGAGRPAVPLVPARGAVAAVGVELNVDYVAVRALDLSGVPLLDQIERDDFRASDPGHALARAAALTERVLEDLRTAGTRVAGIGLALPGLVGKAAGTLRIAPNLGWRDVDLSPLLAAPPFGGLPVILGNEANLAARAEVRARTGPPPSFIYLSGEVGVGGAIVQDGAVLLGPRGGAGEIGHTTVEPDGPPCTCGSQGCLERYAGKDALLSRAGLPPEAPISALAAQAGLGEADAIAAIAHAGWALGIAASNAANLVAIEHIVLGGSFVAIAEHLRPSMEAELRRRVLLDPWLPVTVEVAAGGSYPAVTGAALAVLEAVVADPLAWSAT